MKNISKAGSLVKGASVGCLATTLLIGFPLLISTATGQLDGNGQSRADTYISLFGVVSSVVIFSAIAWFTGLFTVGWTLWRVCEKCNLLSKKLAILLGICICGSLSFLLWSSISKVPNNVSENNVSDTLLFLGFPAIGGVVGWIIWRDAYCKKPATPASEAIR